MREPLSAVMAEILAANIKGLRLSLGDTQTEFAERFGVSQASVARWEDGAEPKNSMLFRIAQLAGASPEKFSTQILSYDRRPALLAAPWDEGTLFLPVRLPSEAALTEMFETLLQILDDERDRDVLAQRLAQLLPGALAQTAAVGPVGRTAAVGPLPDAPDGQAPETGGRVQRR
jgi:transcriptional regulator with XRE-family HTH domain